MSARLPLVLDDRAQVQRLQVQDSLDSDKTRLAGQDDFRTLENNFRLLLVTVAAAGIELPDELQIETARYAE